MYYNSSQINKTHGKKNLLIRERSGTRTKLIATCVLTGMLIVPSGMLPLTTGSLFEKKGGSCQDEDPVWSKYGRREMDSAEEKTDDGTKIQKYCRKILAMLRSQIQNIRDTSLQGKTMPAWQRGKWSQ